ncbi:hypothetical protein GOP47_0005128 [Adiantum capillus-veneris]|uniref:Uncharacterized protein n=1 Tax=Adiantum capillus-veneris TaxID=13818 RepID=A0A9D4V4K2_ADICA|nr:hypothetical protein GOP47_0005128 [Adiantum capillus-veneris]
MEELRISCEPIKIFPARCLVQIRRWKGGGRAENLYVPPGSGGKVLPGHGGLGGGFCSHKNSWRRKEQRGLPSFMSSYALHAFCRKLRFLLLGAEGRARGAARVQKAKHEWALKLMQRGK